MIDKLVASSAGMAAALYLMAGSLAWYRLFRPRPTSLPHVRRVILDRAIAWTSLAVLFYSIAVIKLGWYDWSGDGIDIVRIVALTAIWACGVFSVHAITTRHFRYNATGWFAGLSFAVGVVILFL